MKIVLKRVGGGPTTIEAFADQHGLVMEVVERSKSANGPYGATLSRYSANFQHVEIMDRGMLESSFGNGNTPTDAVADYAKRIEGRRLVYKAYSLFERKEFEAPNVLEVGDVASG